MPITVAVMLWIAAWIAASAVAHKPSSARYSPLIVVPMLPLPWVVRAPFQEKVVLALAITYLVLATADFAAGKRPVTLAGRLWYVIAFGALVDSMSMVRVPRQFDRHAARCIAVAGVAAVIAVLTWRISAELPAVFRVPARLVAAAAVVLVAAELNTRIVAVLSAAVGVQFAAIHDDPYRSRTITEFWSRRWNRLGARWFRQHVFVRLRAVNVMLAVFALFGLSAAIHVYLIAAVVPTTWMAMWAAFFLAQPLLMMAERRLDVRRWPAHSARAWTFGIMIALLPLVLTPLLAAVGLAL